MLITETRLPKISRWSISTRLLLTVNSICLVLLLVFIVHDHHQEMTRRLSDKRIALQEECAILWVAVQNLRSHGVEDLQPFVDRTCAQMEETHSPGHHILLEFSDHVIQADSHGRADDQMLQSMKVAVDDESQLGSYQGQDMIVGVRSGKRLSVYVSELVADVRSEVLLDSFRRLGGSMILAMIAGFIVNLVLVNVVVRPISRLAMTVDAIGDGGYGRQINGFRSRELYFLGQAINRMSDSLAAAETQRQIQMTKARRLQLSLLPEQADLSGATFTASYVPADEVAGDFYDVQKLPDGSWIIFFADVTGHGIPAAMTAALLKTYFEDACDRCDNVQDIAQHINRRFVNITLPEDFATGVLIRYVPTTHLIQILNAGHDSVILSTSGEIREFKSSGLFLGFMEAAEWEVDEYRVSKADRLFLFTDGLTETFDSNQKMFGRDNVLEILNQASNLAPSVVLKNMNNAASSFRSGPQLDDITMIVIEF